LNVPIVRNYLLSLKPGQVGTQLSGVQLSDGTFRRRGQSFLANASNRRRGLHAYKFGTTLDGQRFEIHYLWVSTGFKALDMKSFPSCAGDGWRRLVAPASMQKHIAKPKSSRTRTAWSLPVS
jgi:hypothetical protein